MGSAPVYIRCAACRVVSLLLYCPPVRLRFRDGTRFAFTSVMKRLFFLIAILLMASAMADDWHPHEDIRAAAADAVRLQRAMPGARAEIVADDIDARVRLTRCAEPLAVKLPFDGRRSSRVTTEVRCSGPKPWKMFVPVRLVIYQSVLVAARVLPKGSSLTADDLVLAERDTGRMNYGYLVRLEDAVGQRLRRPLGLGDALTPANLETPALITRGQRVTLEARGRGLTVRMAGVAEADGIRGQIIPVKNLRSGEKVQAVVRSAKAVEVLLQ